MSEKCSSDSFNFHFICSYFLQSIPVLGLETTNWCHECTFIVITTTKKTFRLKLFRDQQRFPTLELRHCLQDLFTSVVNSQEVKPASICRYVQNITSFTLLNASKSQLIKLCSLTDFSRCHLFSCSLIFTCIFYSVSFIYPHFLSTFHSVLWNLWFIFNEIHCIPRRFFIHNVMVSSLSPENTDFPTCSTKILNI